MLRPFHVEKNKLDVMRALVEAQCEMVHLSTLYNSIRIKGVEIGILLFQQ